MPVVCCVPNCDSNRSRHGPYVTVFRFPTNDKVKSHWEKAIGNNYKATPSSRICIKHFEDKYFRGTSANSRVLLGRSAVPTLFMPKLIFEEPYLTFEYLCKNYKQLISDKDYYANITDDLICFYKIDCTAVPTITSSIKIFKNMEFEIFKRDKILPRNLNIRFKRIDEKEQLLYILQSLEVFKEDENNLLAADTVAKIIESLNHIAKLYPDHKRKIDFLTDQITNLINLKLTYRSTTISEACCIFQQFPSAYNYLRDQNILVLPTSRYLKSILANELNGTF
ncbi:hypothetical protein ILUMI_13211 [Ignelater luminosus]|uniref:THAP-type domain-containing protein n=1 Tax=Ignelater luminosus TaxID=2038154 RepID=A0A8K0GC74_IGNLU|nr:hypothetical protein ILUMI_13211 [Ignelater luminosus]